MKFSSGGSSWLNRFLGTGFAVACLLFVTGDLCNAQHSSLYAKKNILGQRVPLTMKEGSLTYTEVAETRSLQKNEIVQVRIDELARVSSDGSSERRKNLQLDGILNDWIRFNGFRKLEKDQQSTGDPQVKGSLQETIRSEASKQATQRLTESIGCRIVDIRPNGNLVLMGRKEVRFNNEVWLMSVHGMCRQQDIDRGNVVKSDRMIDLRIQKITKGAVRDGTRRGWLKKFYDRVSPF